MLVLQSYEEFLELLGNSVKMLEDSGKDLRTLFKSYGDWTSFETEVQLDELKELFKMVSDVAYENGKADGRLVGFQEGLEQSQYGNY